MKYTIVDSGGLCLGLTSPAGCEAWSSIDVEICNGATEHKWNATANLTSSVLQDIDEIPTPLSRRPLPADFGPARTLEP